MRLPLPGLKEVLEDPTITTLAQKYNVSPAQVVLAWHIARGVSVACKSANPERQKQNIDVRDVFLYSGCARADTLLLWYEAPDPEYGRRTEDQRARQG